MPSASKFKGRTKDRLAVGKRLMNSNCNYAIDSAEQRGPVQVLVVDAIYSFFLTPRFLIPPFLVLEYHD
jgi:hypothetical protein